MKEINWKEKYLENNQGSQVIFSLLLQHATAAFIETAYYLLILVFNNISKLIVNYGIFAKPML